MSIIKSEDSSKWITALVIIGAALCGFVVFKFAQQMGVWFDLEAKLSSFNFVSQAVGFVSAVIFFAVVMKNSKTSTYLQDVYNELLKVVWPTKDATLKITMGLVVALVIVSAIFVFVDFVFKKILSFVY
jgi:preprotein translocase subunit SecE